MTFYIEGRTLVSDTQSVRYEIRPPLQKVLQTLPDESPVPQGMVMLGILAEQLVPIEADAEDHIQVVLDNLEEAPETDVPSETVKGIKWLLAEVRASIPPERARAIGKLVTEAKLNSSGATEPPTDSTSEQSTTSSSDASRGSTGSSDSSEDKTSNQTASSEDVSSASSQQAESNNEDTSKRRSGQKASNSEHSSKYTTESSDPLRENRDRANSDNFECEFCDKPFQVEADLVSHTTSCAERPTDARYECHYCGNKYVSEQALTRHQSQCNDKTVNSAHGSGFSSTYECSNCGETFDSRRKLNRHEYSCESTKSPRQSNRTGSRFVEDRVTGSVANFESADGYGFITIAGRSDDVFFHISAYEGTAPEEGDVLQFDLIEGDEGLKAVNVSDAGSPDADSWDTEFASNRPQWGRDS